MRILDLAKPDLFHVVTWGFLIIPAFWGRACRLILPQKAKFLWGGVADYLMSEKMPEVLSSVGKCEKGWEQGCRKTISAELWDEIGELIGLHPEWCQWRWQWLFSIYWTIQFYILHNNLPRWGGKRIVTLIVLIFQMKALRHREVR